MSFLISDMKKIKKTLIFTLKNDVQIIYFFIKINLFG